MLDHFCFELTGLPLGTKGSVVIFPYRYYTLGHPLKIAKNQNPQRDRGQKSDVRR